MAYIFFGKQVELFERDRLTMNNKKVEQSHGSEVYEVVRPGDTLRVRDAYGRVVVVIKGRYAIGFTRLYVFTLGISLGLLASALVSLLW